MKGLDKKAKIYELAVEYFRNEQGFYIFKKVDFFFPGTKVVSLQFFRNGDPGIYGYLVTRLYHLNQ